MKDNLSKEESLAIITSMITTAKGNVSQGVFHMLLWGWVIFVVSLSHFILLKYQLIAHPELVWLLMIPTLVVSLVAGFIKGRKEMVRTHLDTQYMWIWLTLAITTPLMIFFLVGKWDIINPMILLLAGYATFLSGKLISFKPMVYGAICFWIWALIAYFAGPLYGTMVTSLAILTGYIIPGYLLKRKYNAA